MKTPSLYISEYSCYRWNGNSGQMDRIWTEKKNAMCKQSIQDIWQKQQDGKRMYTGIFKIEVFEEGK